ncbi:DUF3037 domain-containing protein [Parvibium lacunae]|uniref:DUF3037 domain-containing protein n=1 Tax=Parvibium lacunae TaxID=1888893 RepID=UPI001314BC57|nr:DUF3037 domain-containing protein [Parvibium lacunae]
MSSPFACRYAILQFLPYVETGEFANIGVVLFNHEQGSLHFQLLKNWKRVTDFFDLDTKAPLNACLKLVTEDLERVSRLLATLRGQGKPEPMRSGLFDELIRRRETMFRFSPVRALLTADANEAVKQLYAQYVEHRFATKENQEVLLERELKLLFQQNKLAERYRSRAVGDALFEYEFPFVAEQGQRIRIIKPLHLTHQKLTKAVDHGVQWAGRIRELRRRALLNGEVLFTLQTGADLPHQQVAQEVTEILQEVEASVLPHHASERILTFARQGF